MAEGRRLEDTFTREQLLVANAALLRRNAELESGIDQENLDVAMKCIEGFCVMAIAASNGNFAAKENTEKLLDALRIMQGKPIKLPRVIETPNGPVMIEPEDKSDAIPDVDDGAEDLDNQYNQKEVGVQHA